jgi:hypothetical protein
MNIITIYNLYAYMLKSNYLEYIKVKHTSKINDFIYLSA